MVFWREGLCGIVSWAVHRAPPLFSCTFLITIYLLDTFFFGQLFVQRRVLLWIHVGKSLLESCLSWSSVELCHRVMGYLVNLVPCGFGGSLFAGYVGISPPVCFLLWHFLHALLFLFLVASECCVVPSVSKFGNLLRHGWIEFVVANLEKADKAGWCCSCFYGRCSCFCVWVLLPVSWFNMGKLSVDLFESATALRRFCGHLLLLCLDQAFWIMGNLQSVWISSFSLTTAIFSSSCLDITVCGIWLSCIVVG